MISTISASVGYLVWWCLCSWVSDNALCPDGATHRGELLVRGLREVRVRPGSSPHDPEPLPDFGVQRQDPSVAFCVCILACDLQICTFFPLQNLECDSTKHQAIHQRSPDANSHGILLHESVVFSAKTCARSAPQGAKPTSLTTSVIKQEATYVDTCNPIQCPSSQMLNLLASQSALASLPVPSLTPGANRG
ncbi:hypothetical protein B0T14DRAFT_501694 [Immersiella caudata]|uniref:Uncharacterized protein n=1 Tax=Immersiella caudata TaxID=314043 RepID=A0AA39XCJ5_9PEZI|nr:hypothetical protein B0T14DRAFT_501694 [Immersiella caudata]